jgi:hypothetical protein
MIFRQVQASWMIIALRTVFLYCLWQLVLLCRASWTCPLWVPPLLLYLGARGYNEGNRVGYNMIRIKTLCLLAYFTYIFIDRISYALGSTPWPSRIFLMVG